MPNSFGLWHADTFIGQVKLSIITTYNLCVDICIRFGIDQQYLWKKCLSLRGGHLHMYCSRRWSFWGNESFGELTMHHTSPPSRGEFRAKIVSYDSNRNCLVSSLSFHATQLHVHGPTVSKHVTRLLANPHVLVQRSLRCAHQAYTANTYNYNLICYLVAAAIT